MRAALLAFTRRLQPLREPGRGTGAVAVDGKTLRGVREGGAQLHVLHAFAQRGALALDQVAVASVPEEVPAARAWVAAVADAFPGLTVLTADALFADRDLCAGVVAGRRDYLIRLKKTRPASSPTRRSSSPPAPARPARSR